MLINGGIIRYRPQLRARRHAGTSLFHFVKLVYCPEKREPTGHTRRATICRLPAIPRSADLFHPAEFWVIFVGSIFRPAPPLGVVGSRDTPVGNTRRAFLSLNVPNRG